MTNIKSGIYIYIYIKLRMIFCLIFLMTIIVLSSCDNSSSETHITTATTNISNEKMNIIGSEIEPPVIIITDNNDYVNFLFDVTLTSNMLALLQQNQSLFDNKNYVLLSINGSIPNLNDNEFQHKEWDIVNTKSDYKFEFIYKRSDIGSAELSEIDQVISGEKKYFDLSICFYNSNEKLFHVINTYAQTQ